MSKRIPASIRTLKKKRVQMETFPERLAGAIKRTGLSRPEFAAKAGIGTSVLAKWLSGKLIPKSSQLLSIARTSGYSMEWLLTGDSTGGATTEERIEEVVTRIKKWSPKGRMSGKEEARTRDSWREIFEADDERLAARGSRDGPPDLLALVEMLESARAEFWEKLIALGDVLHEVDPALDEALSERLHVCWQAILLETKRLVRRESGLVAEVRAKCEPEPF
jgi:transcriptional regulator with XRE-family HTH domain